MAFIFVASAMEDDCSVTPVATLDSLADEILAACIGRLTLWSLPHLSTVNHRWRQAARLAFASQLRWRAAVQCCPLSLAVPAVPARSLQNPIRREAFSLAYLHGGDLVVQLVDAQAAAVRTVCFGNGSLELYEAPPREFAEHGPFNAGVGGVVGYRHASADGMSFFPAVECGGTAPSASVWIAEGDWQNVLQAGNLVFLLRAHPSWWEAEDITADLLDTDTGGRAVVDVTPLRDALRAELRAAFDRPARGAVSAVDGHFIFHLSTQSGAKAAAALRLPAHVPRRGLGNDNCVDPSADAAVAFARRWPATHGIARGDLTNEKPCGEYLMLWEDGHIHSESRDDLSPTHHRFKAHVVLLCASSGVAAARWLSGPSTDGPQGSVAVAFGYGGIAAIDYKAASDVVAACSLPRAGLPPPAVLLWDWRSAACLHAVLLHPLPPDPLRRPRSCPILQEAPHAGPRPLRFAIGAQVECRMGEALWLPGVVAAHHVSSSVAGQPPFPYLIHLDRGDACYASLDRPETIRARADVAEVCWNERTQSMEVAATASLVLHPSSSRLAIGLWHNGAAAGMLYSISMVDVQTSCD